MKTILRWLCGSCLLALPLGVAAEGKPGVTPERVLGTQSWSGPQFLQADKKGHLYLLRSETLEIFPLTGSLELGEPVRLGGAASPAGLMPEPVLSAAMSRHGDWVVQMGSGIRIFRGGKERSADPPGWMVRGVGLLGNDPVIVGFPSSFFAEWSGQPQSRSDVPGVALWDGQRWNTFLEFPSASDGLWSSMEEEVGGRLYGTSDGRLWIAGDYKHRLREYSSAGRLLTEMVVGAGKVERVANADKLLAAVAKEEARLSSPQMKVQINEMTGKAVTLALTEGRDGRLYLLLRRPAEGADVTLERYDPVTLELHRLPVAIPDPGRGTLAAGKDGLYAAAFQSKGGIWRIASWEALDAAPWELVEDAKVQGRPEAEDDQEGRAEPPRSPSTAWAMSALR